MRKTGWVWGVLAALVGAAGAAEFPLKEAVECRARGGLPNAMARLSAGGEVAIAFLGGSITAAAGYRPQIQKWLQTQYPGVKVREINAAIGGTGSDLGVFRVGQDVLRHKPDLLFVEFAVNDGGAAPEQIRRTMEGIVRQAWKANPATDICFLYTINAPMLDDFKSGKLCRSASAMEDVADHYGIPSVSFGVEVARREKEGRLIFKGKQPKTDAEKAELGARILFTEDGTHPLVRGGHELYTEILGRALTAMKDSGKPGAHALKAARDPLNWEQAKIVPLTKSMLSGQWVVLDPAKDEPAKRFAKELPAMWKATAPGDALAFRFRGRLAGVYDLLGPDGGRLQVKTDDNPERTIARIDGYCVYHRLAQCMLVTKPEDGVHTVAVTLLADAPDKAKILFEHNRPDLEKNPAKYAANVWYAGGLLLIGDLVE